MLNFQVFDVFNMRYLSCNLMKLFPQLPCQRQRKERKRDLTLLLRLGAYTLSMLAPRWNAGILSLKCIQKSLIYTFVLIDQVWPVLVAGRGVAREQQ
jgi:hypothetical protein